MSPRIIDTNKQVRAMKVIFVGIHNKPGLTPLSSASKSGKLIDRVIVGIEMNCDWLKTNLYDVGHLPINQSEKHRLAQGWYDRINHDVGDIVVLLGAGVQNNFIETSRWTTLKFAHPASIWSRKSKAEYVDKMVHAIMEEIRVINSL